MTETQKEIIEIIEPFMEKRGGEIGEYVGDKGKDCYYNCEIHFGKIVGFREDNGWSILVLDNGKENHSEDMNCCGKIYGHYDITAVLKYIEYKIGYKNIFYKLSTARQSMFIDSDENQENDFIAEIPNKPLHLYTEEENKNLLELLKQLGTKK